VLLDWIKLVTPYVCLAINLRHYELVLTIGAGNPGGFARFDNMGPRIDKIESKLDIIESLLTNINNNNKYIKQDIKVLKSFRWWFIGITVIALTCYISIFYIVNNIQINNLKENTNLQMNVFKEQMNIKNKEFNDKLDMQNQIFSEKFNAQFEVNTVS
jgi:hypothetical protein